MKCKDCNTPITYGVFGNFKDSKTWQCWPCRIEEKKGEGEE